MSSPVEIFLPPDSPRALVALERPSKVGDVPPGALIGTVELRDLQPDWSTLELSEGFVELYSSYMRGERAMLPRILSAVVKPREYVYVIDGRASDPQGDVPFHDIVGWYQSGPNGMPIASTFTYNKKHQMFSNGVASSLLRDPNVIRLAYGA